MPSGSSAGAGQRPWIYVRHGEKQFANSNPHSGDALHEPVRSGLMRGASSARRGTRPPGLRGEIPHQSTLGERGLTGATAKLSLVRCDSARAYFE